MIEYLRSLMLLTERKEIVQMMNEFLQMVTLVNDSGTDIIVQKQSPGCVLKKK